MSNNNAVIENRYIDRNGQQFTVIGDGTQGIVIEYNDGRVEIINRDVWPLLECRLCNNEDVAEA